MVIAPCVRDHANTVTHEGEQNNWRTCYIGIFRQSPEEAVPIRLIDNKFIRDIQTD